MRGGWAAAKELQRVALPSAYNHGVGRRGDADQFGRAGLYESWGEGDGGWLGLSRGGEEGCERKKDESSE